ncbi:MAG TPA: AMP-binding protein, partial [Bdellovibrionota bacterium]|nr:AMP-binding protein [Bdellovibrionota bacterium]
MAADPLIPVPKVFSENSWCDGGTYKKMYEQSISDPERFWADQAKRLDWIQPWKRVKDGSFSRDVHIRWFEGGKLNVSTNCVDRHLSKRSSQTAIVWEPNDPKERPQFITYRQLYDEVCRWANVLKAHGVKKGDRVTIYLPMIPQTAYAMLACARIGAVHSVVFGGFSADSLAERINDCQSAVVITAD